MPSNPAHLSASAKLTDANREVLTLIFFRNLHQQMARCCSLGDRPSLYLRHNLDDDGASQTGPLASGPDIIVKNNVVGNPQATYSTPASIKD